MKKNQGIKEMFASAIKEHQKNNLKTAEKFYKKILIEDPNHFDSIFLLGTLLLQTKKFDLAKQFLQKAIQIQPNHTEGIYNLGNTLRELGEFQKAINCYQKVIQINPNYIVAYNNLGTVFEELGDYQRAMICYQKILEIQPNHMDTYYNLGHVLNKLGDYQKAINYYEKAIQIQPDYVDAHFNLANTLKELGEFQKAVNCYQKALEYKPDYVDAHHNILFTLLYFDKADPKYILSKAKEFRFSLKPINDDLLPKHQFNFKPKKLIIGFVSGDFRQHPIGYFLLDTLKHLKEKNLELIAYSNFQKKDSLSFKLKSHFTNWREISNQNNMEVINQVRKDGIHILIDLSGHTNNNRLPIFINRPAPVQITWGGHSGGSTGIPEIDYVIGDPHVIPIKDAEHFTEKIFHLPNIWKCFTAPEFEVIIKELPAIKNGYITFGSFNNLLKINEGVISLWSRILKAIPKSKIFLKTKALNNLYLKKKIISNFEKNNINSNSVILEGTSPYKESLASYNKVDIALDSFPFSGCITTFEAIWMGVPVLTKKGNAFVSRQTESINYNIGMSDWIAKDNDEYIIKATQFASNLEKLTEIRVNLRKKALNSPAFNASLFAEHFNNTLWKMWNNFISKNGE